MSERNGDKARFQRQRKHKILYRMRIRELRKTLEHNKAIKEPLMISVKRLVITVIGIVLSAHVLSAQDLSMYRDFHVGMSVASVTKQTAANPSEVKVIHQRPAVIQELTWRARPALGGSSLQTDPVQEIAFSFYNDELFRRAATDNVIARWEDGQHSLNLIRSSYKRKPGSSTSQRFVLDAVHTNSYARTETSS